MQDTAELFFEDCRVPASHLLGVEGAGFKYMMEKLQQERLEVCIKCQVNAEEALKEGLDYAKVREAFGRPIGDSSIPPSNSRRMATEVELGSPFSTISLAAH